MNARSHTQAGRARTGGARVPGFSLREALPRLTMELGPPFSFFAVTKIWDIYVGTLVLVLTSAVSVVVSRRWEGRWPIIPIAGVVLSALLALVMLYTREPMFIMVRPTIYNGAGAIGLAIATWRGWLPLRDIFGKGLGSSEEAWRQVTIGLIVFLVFLSVLNEIVWRVLGQGPWVTFKAFGLPLLNGLFALFAWWRLRRGHRNREAEANRHRPQEPPHSS